MFLPSFPLIKGQAEFLPLDPDLFVNRSCVVQQRFALVFLGVDHPANGVGDVPGGQVCSQVRVAGDNGLINFKMLFLEFGGLFLHFLLWDMEIFIL